MVHAPAEHAPTALGGAHTTPQPPQLVGLAPRSASQPSAVIPSQSPYPGVHAMPHAPDTQVAVAFGPPGQTVPHEPQAVGLVARGVAQAPGGSVAQWP